MPINVDDLLRMQCRQILSYLNEQKSLVTKLTDVDFIDKEKLTVRYETLKDVEKEIQAMINDIDNSEG